MISVLLSVLSASPVLSVQSVTQRPRVETSQAKTVTAQIEQALAANGLPMMTASESAQRLDDKKLNPTKCGGAKTCIIGVAAGLGAVVIAVDVGQLRKQVLVRIDAISPEGEELAEAVEVSAANADLKAALDTALDEFAAKLKAKLSKPEVVAAKQKTSERVSDQSSRQGGWGDRPEKDSAAKPALLPREKDDGPELMVSAQPKPKVAKWVFAGGAVVTAGAAVGLGVSALTTAGSVDASGYDVDGMRATTLTQSQLDARAAQANTMGTAAVITALVSAGLTATATVLFIKGDGP
ncbi:MAG: hypothetical protein JNM17_25080 [Archangium sp.]|nr:hypothetical protein [Archangium sp.]